MLEKIKSMIPVIALVIMILGVSYISASDEKRPQRWTPHTVNIQRIIKINNSVKL